MAAPLSTTGVASDAGVWQELEELFARLGQLARSHATPEVFYRTLLDESLRALSADGGAVWLRAAGGAFQPVAQINWPAADFARSDELRRAHEELLTDAAGAERGMMVPPRSTSDRHALFFAPVRTWTELGNATVAIVELLVRPDASPAAYRGCEQFLTAASELAADFHAFEELQRLRSGDSYRDQLIELGAQVHRSLHLSETAYAAANEGRRVIGCDRLSVLLLRGGRCTLLSTSGVGRVERRSQAARRLEDMAEMVARTDEPAFYADGQSDALPPIVAAMELHAEESQARQIAAVPLRPLAAPNDDEAGSAASSRHRDCKPNFVLVAEQFDARGGELSRERLVEVGQVCVSALENVLEVDRLPLGWLWRSLGAAKEQLVEHLPRSTAALAGVAAAIAALVLVPADFKIDAQGTLEPVVRQDVFAPRSGIVDEVLVQHGSAVKVGTPLVRLRDPQLDLELKRVGGELETTQRQVDAVRATRTNRAVRDANPMESYRLSADERELGQRLTNLQREQELLNAEREKLVVTSPISGSVLTWDLNHRLDARPVERGEVLLSVADLADKWQLELEVPDDRIGHVLAAQQELQPNLPVRFRLSSDDRQQHSGNVAEVCQTANVSKEAAKTSPTVLVKVALDPMELTAAECTDVRPGVSARAQIACGRRSLGYVWLHDVWDAAWRWLRF